MCTGLCFYAPELAVLDLALTRLDTQLSSIVQALCERVGCVCGLAWKIDLKLLGYLFVDSVGTDRSQTGMQRLPRSEPW